MNKNMKWYCKRKALGFSKEEMAAIAGVDVGTYSLFEKGEWVDHQSYSDILSKTERYIRDLPRDKYLITRIIEETLNYKHEGTEDHAYTLSHMMIHVSKLNMMYVDGRNID